MLDSSSLDAVIVSSYGFFFASHIATDGASVTLELHLDDRLADFDFLDLYFSNGRNLDATKRKWAEKPPREKTPTYLCGVYLSDFLRKKLQLRVQVINAFCLEKTRLDHILTLNPRFAIISTTMITLPEHIREITAFIRERSPSITIIAGGLKVYKSHKTKKMFEAGRIPEFTKECLAPYNLFFGPKDDCIDYYIVNPKGEDTLLRLISALQHGEDGRAIDNVAYYTGPETFYVNPITEEPNHLNDWCIDWSCVEEEIIGSEIPITVKQGCPFQCNFCDFVRLDREVTGRSLDLVVQELRAVAKRFNNRDIFFVDDNLFFNKRQLKEFCTRLIKEHLVLRWRGLGRATCIDEETASLLKKAGCYSFTLGLESCDDRVLQNMNKKSTVKQNFDAVRFLNNVGIDPYFTFVIGFPGETEETVRRTIDTVKSLPRTKALNFYNAFPFILVPLCPAATKEFREKSKLVGAQNWWQHPTMNFREATKHAINMFLEMDDVFLRYLNSTEASLFRNDIPQHRTILQARQRIVQSRIRGISVEVEEKQWNIMEQAFGELSSASIKRTHCSLAQPRQAEMEPSI